MAGLLHAILPRAYNPATNLWLAQYGPETVVAIAICRYPLPAAMEESLARLSARPWTVIKAEEGIDALVHLSMIIITSRGESQLEKNAGQGLTFSNRVDSFPGSVYASVPYGQRRETVNTLLQRTRQLQGDDHYFLYDAFNANCQDFVWAFLVANNLDTPALRAFVTQPTEGLISKAFPPHIQTSLKMFTDARTLFGSGDTP
jgi:hypothetical protein